MSEPELIDEVLQLLTEDRKIEAIKRYREGTGLGLAEAKQAVEALERGLRPERAHLNQPLPATPEKLMAEVLQLVRDKHYLLAVKRYRDATGSSLKESREAIDKLMSAHGLEPPKSGCGSFLFGMLVFMFCAGVACYLFFAAN